MDKPSGENMVGYDEDVCVSCHTKLKVKVNISISNDPSQNAFHQAVFREDKILEARIKEYIQYRISQKEAYSDAWQDIYTDGQNEILKKCIDGYETGEYIKENTERISKLGIKTFPAFLFNNKILIEGNSEKYKALILDLSENQGLIH